MAPHSSTLAWKIPWAEEPGGLQSMGSWTVGHDWVTSLSLFTFMHWRKWQPSSVLAWRIPGLGEPGGLPSMGSHRVGHDWSDLAAAAAAAGSVHPSESAIFLYNSRAMQKSSWEDPGCWECVLAPGWAAWWGQALSPTCLSYPSVFKGGHPLWPRSQITRLIYVFKIDTLTQAGLTDTQLNELY